MTPPKINQFPFYIKLPMVLVSLIAIVYLAILGKEVLSPLIFSLLFSILLLPVSVFFERKLKLKRSASAGLAVIFLLAVVAGIIFLVGSQISKVTNDLPMLKQQIIISLQNLQHWISREFGINLEKQMDYVSSATSKIETATPSVIGATVVSVSSMLLFIVFIILDTFFLLFYRKMFLHFLVEVFKRENAAIVYDIVATVQSILRQYIVGILIEMTTVAIVCCGVFLLIGIKYPILLGLITALFNIVPYIGIFTALALNILITFASSGDASSILFVIITVVSVHLIDSNILLPAIVGSKVRINAFITLLSVVVGELIWGISGMFLSIPVIAIAKIVFDRIDSLKPWGHLLGYEKIVKKKIKVKAG